MTSGAQPTEVLINSYARWAIEPPRCRQDLWDVRFVPKLTHAMERSGARTPTSKAADRLCL
jgi:hypothetical protein